MDHTVPGSSVHGNLQARILEWIAMSSSRGSSQLRDRTQVSDVYLHWQTGSLALVPPGKPIKIQSSGNSGLCQENCSRGWDMRKLLVILYWPLQTSLFISFPSSLSVSLLHIWCCLIGFHWKKNQYLALTMFLVQVLIPFGIFPFIWMEVCDKCGRKNRREIRSISYQYTFFFPFKFYLFIYFLLFGYSVGYVGS